jgi:hypothetical protein
MLLLLLLLLFVTSQDSLLEHVASLASLSHPNLVRICGVVIDPPLVVTEFHKHSLDSILHQAHQQWRGAEPAAADALNSIGRRQVGVANNVYNVCHVRHVPLAAVCRRCISFLKQAALAVDK